MTEQVRLVVWDLDETFWHGTLTEGGIRPIKMHSDIVIELSHRGIMNSVCSRNDLEPVRDALILAGVWDHLVFPSVNWSAKPERIAAIIAAMKLRPESVLFVDDNASNRAAAVAAIPGLRAVDETAIQTFLDDPIFAGKPDPDLSRLKQYKVLEAKEAGLAVVGDDNVAFLRASGITVTIIYDIETHIDRAVELINRTNQLNFTKRRLAADRNAAAAELLAEIAPFHVKAGLLSVQDRYGDYGICGIFVVFGMAAHAKPRLLHFAFSCRTLGMGVEQWVYELLGRPQLEIVGDVLSDLSWPVDWINAKTDIVVGEEGDNHRFGAVRIRGGCELEVLEHFFRAQSQFTHTEFIAGKGGLYFPAQNSAILSRAGHGLSSTEQRIISGIGMDASFYETALFDPCEPNTLILYSPTGDAMHPMRRHRATGFEAPVWFREPLLPEHPHRTDADRALFDSIQERLADDFETLSFDDITMYPDCYHKILSRIPHEAFLIVLLPNRFHNHDGIAVEHIKQTALNQAFRAAAVGHENVAFIEMTDMIANVSEISEQYLHFNRAVYRRVFERICTLHDAHLKAGRPYRQLLLEKSAENPSASHRSEPSNRLE